MTPLTADQARDISNKNDKDEIYFNEIMTKISDVANQGLSVLYVSYDHMRHFPEERLSSLGYIVTKTPNGILPHTIKW